MASAKPKRTVAEEWRFADFMDCKKGVVVMFFSEKHSVIVKIVYICKQTKKWKAI